MIDYLLISKDCTAKGLADIITLKYPHIAGTNEVRVYREEKKKYTCDLLTAETKIDDASEAGYCIVFEVMHEEA